MIFPSKYMRHDESPNPDYPKQINISCCCILSSSSESYVCRAPHTNKLTFMAYNNIN
ncbi:unnamed protein product [Amoebophrya sp. A25]|nr:unnamed protein product [Amoebophrya sp. A25]|eukprot:GSA25T00013997001.1